MIELHVVWQQMHFFPGNRLIIVVGLGDFLNPRAVGFNNHVTVHADVQRRYARMTAHFGGRMTVLTVDVVFACMGVMRKWNRLVGFITLIVTDNDFVTC